VRGHRWLNNDRDCDAVLCRVFVKIISSYRDMLARHHTKTTEQYRLLSLSQSRFSWPPTMTASYMLAATKNSYLLLFIQFSE